MEFAEVELTCKRCGTVFQYKKACNSRLDAEILKDRALRLRQPLCPGCMRQDQEAAQMEKAVQMGLPELVGRTEKQIAYALSLRNKYVCNHEGAVRKAQALLETIDASRAMEVAKKNGFADPEECVAAAFRQRGLFREYMCLTESSARTLIDILVEKKPERQNQP